MMPSKRIKVGSNGKFSGADLHNPRVILRPLRADSSGHSRSHFVTEPPISSLFNKPELSDIKLIVGDNSYYAHRLVLCAGSDVFSRMLGTNWIENKKSELHLQEEEECVKVFDRFLAYFYTGSIMISESYAIPLFLLADKYDIKPLYDECVKVIENGLKVYIVSRSQSTQQPGLSKPTPSTSAVGPSMSYMLSSGSAAYSDSSDSDSESRGSPSIAPQEPLPSTSKTVSDQQSIHLVASETFPLTLVLKMLTYCHNDRIASAALYNLQARLASQIKHNNFGVWNDLHKELLLRILKNDHFCCPEYILFKAAKSWLLYQESRKSDTVEVLSCIRYPILSPDELYVIEKDEVIKECAEADYLVREAIRYKLFQNCSIAIQSEEWNSLQYQPRQVKET